MTEYCILDDISRAIESGNIHDLLERYKAEPCHVKISSSATYLGYVRTFLKWLVRSKKEVNTFEDMDRYIDEYVEEKKERNTDEYCNNVAWCLNKFVHGANCTRKPECVKKKRKQRLGGRMHEESRRVLEKFEKSQFKDCENEMLTQYLVRHMDDFGDRAAFLLLLLKTGMRFVELYKMTLGQLRQLADTKSTVVLAKGNKNAVIFTNDDGALAARRIVSLYPEVPDNVQVFAPPSEDLDPLAYKNKYNSMYASVLRFAKNVQQEALGGTSCNRALHAFRRTFANNVYKKSNNDVALVAKMLNHADIRHTLRYIANDVDVMRSAAEEQ